MKTILVGNGFNIELGGVDYQNKAIINRVLTNIKNKDYISLYDNKASKDELADCLPGMYGELKEILKDKYVNYCTNEEDKELISILKDRYSLSVKIDKVGMEDYFIILRLFHIRFKDDAAFIKNIHDAFRLLFLDAIYNEGHIQKVADMVLPAYREYLKKRLQEYNDIYTVNYDKTVEIISDRDVNYLHGDFETLLDQYDPNTLVGSYYQQKGEKNPVTDVTRHIYCNALMGFSGFYKEEIMNTMDNKQFGADRILKMYEDGLSIQDMKEIERLKNSQNTAEQLAFGIINAKINNPKLRMNQYPMQKFKKIHGEIYLLGISPSNDEHIWNVIIGNNNVTKIVYYYHSDVSRKDLEKKYSDTRISYLRDTEFWGT